MRNPFQLKNGMDRGSRLSRAGENMAFEESYLEESQQGYERLVRSRPRWLLLTAIAALSFAVIFLRLFFLTVTEHEQYLAIAEDNRLRIEFLPAPRGAVYDRYGTVIAGNRPSFELVAVPLDLPDEESARTEVVRRAAEISGIDPAQIFGLLEEEGQSDFESVLVKQNISREQALIFSERVRELPGFRVVNAPIRDYHAAPAYAHLLGYVGKISGDQYQRLAGEGYLYNDTIGKTGLEEVYEGSLRGTFGQRQVEVDARGFVEKVFGETNPAPGSDLYLHIDAGLQETIYDSLTRRLSTLNKKRAAAIAMDPRDGRVLALVSLPSYDNNMFAEGIARDVYQKLAGDASQPLFNRATGGTYPPGSTVKPMVAAAALQEGVVTSRTIVDDRGYILVPNPYGGPDYFFYGYNRAGLGPVDARKAIALSSDIYFYTVGGGWADAEVEGLGINRLASYYRMFGLDRVLGIDLPGEKAGLVPTPEWKREYFGEGDAGRWFLGNTYHASIGQGDLLATPLHVLSWTATVASGGTIYKPRIADRIEDGGGETIKIFEPEILRQVQIDPQHLKTVQEGMRMTVTEGTARSLSSLPVSSAGKTGTSQFDARNLSRTHAWFTAYAPYEDPQIAIVVLIEDGGEGSSASAPVVREALEWWAENRYLNNEQ